MVSLQELQKCRRNMRPVSTRIRTADGKERIEEKQHDGSTIVKDIPTTIFCGFVIDEKPDLDVGEITDNLLVGGQDVAKDSKTLISHRITHLLNVAGDYCASCPSGLQYCQVDILDLPSFNIQSSLEVCFAFIDSAVQSGGRVLCYCNAGVSRSVTVVTAYLMKYRKLDFNSALNMVRLKRTAAKPNAGFVEQLKLLELEYSANSG